ncbi:MAG: radical SAM protein [Phycisphaerae bacterium]|nr:radical SAM protein [Phycisphaerae bacterium]
MELPRRLKDDVYLPDGAFRERVDVLRRMTDRHDLAIGIMYAFDFRTRMLPFWYADKRMAPCSVRLLGDALHDAGFANLRIVLQQWSPRVLPSHMRLNGRPLDILLVSAMQVHAERAYDLIRDAHRTGADRPLILAGGPKAIYEPTDFFELGPGPGIGADCVVTGEAFVLLELLHTVLAGRRGGETAREAFENVRLSGALAKVPGLVYLSPDAPSHEPLAVTTGVQRLVRDLDELPMPDAGYRLIEPPHRRRTLSPRPCSAERVGRLSNIASLISTQGCRFNCSYCPIPAVNQGTWRHKSPSRLAAEIRHIHEDFGIRSFFSTDDNFFNNRRTVIELMTELAGTQVAGEPLGERIRFFTEATESDVYKNRDLLPLARAGGLRAIWFGIEDISATLVNKGQTADKTSELFALLPKLGIEPMAMMIHSDDQPLRSPRDDLRGLLNQARYLFNQGAVSYQCTYLGPAVGTRDFEPACKAGTIFKRVGGRVIPQAHQDGNHVVASRHPRPWQQQLNVLRAYAAFYNPLNMLRVIRNLRREPLGCKRLVFQLAGQVGLLLTAPRLLAWARRLKRGPIEPYTGLETARIPMIDAATDQETNWAIEHLPSLPRPTCRYAPGPTLQVLAVAAAPGDPA